ncbi:MAG: hypothetical protein KGZ74_01945 [Chitinophagaceae bacterium]|nr:hypothetical protein [Chitinophagaceae bacterium]
MKKIIFLALFHCLFSLIQAQTSSIFWGDDMKIKRGTTELNIITADKTGVYVQEGGVRYFTIDFRNMTGVKFRKFDKFYNEVYEQDFKQELKGKDLNRIVPFKDRLFIFADDYDKKEKRFITYAAEIDKNSGNLKGDWKEIVTIPKEDKKDDYEFAVLPSADSSSIVLVADISNKEYASLKVLVMDEQLKQRSATDITLQFSKNTYELEDVLYTTDQQIIVTGKVYEEVQVKKKRTRLMFKKLSLEKFDITGKKMFDLPTVSAGNVMLSAKVVSNKQGDLFVCGYFSNNPKSLDVNGIVINRINPKNGTILLSTEKIIDPTLIGTYDDDADDDKDAETKQSKAASKKAAEDDELDGFSSDYRFRRVYIGQDNSILLIAEKFRFTSYTYTQSNYINGRMTYQTYTVYRYTCGDIMTTKVTSDGSIQFLNVIPKNQVEEIRGSSGYRSSPGAYSSIFIGGGLPFYSSFNCVPYKNKLVFYFNDNEKNMGVTKTEHKFKSIYNFRKSDCYALTLDLENGSVTRRMLFTNTDEPMAMVRHGMLTGNDLFLVAFRNSMLGRSSIKLGKITIK